MILGARKAKGKMRLHIRPSELLADRKLALGHCRAVPRVERPRVKGPLSTSRFCVAFRPLPIIVCRGVHTFALA